MNDDVRRLVEQIHASPSLAALAVTGAGASAVAWLLGVPAASRTLIEAVVPYGHGAMIELLGGEPDEYVSAPTAIAMAEAALRRGLRLRDSDAPVVGVGATATIATNRPKRGDHRCHVAVSGGAAETPVVYSLTLAKGERDRAGEEELVSLLVLQALAEGCGLRTDLPLDLVAGEHVERDPPAQPR